MNRSRLLGWVLLILVFLIWQFFALKDAEKKEAERLKNQGDSIASAGPRPNEKPDGNGANKNETPQEDYITETVDSVFENKSDSTEAPQLERKIRVETNKFVITLNTKGAQVESIKIKGLGDKMGGDETELLSRNTGALGIKIGPLDLSDYSWSIEGDKNDIRIDENAVSLEFSCSIGGRSFIRRYTFFPDSQKFHHDFLAPSTDKGFVLSWNSGVRETEKITKGKGLGLNYGFFSEVVFDNGTVSRENFEGTKRFNEDSGILRWVGIRRKYVSAMIDFGRDTDYKVTASSIREKADPDKFHTYELSVEGAELDNGSLSFDFIVLPLWYNQALSYGKNYEKIIFTGYSWFLGADVWYVKLCGLVLNALNFFHRIIPNYGIAIILLTLIVRTLLLPLTISQTRSMTKMQEHAPAIKAIREQHKGSPQKMNQETMAYYKKVGVNPLAQMTGCFPMLLQFPVFISLFNVLGRALELKNEPFFLWVSDLSRPDVLVPGVQVPYLFPMGLTVLPFFMALTMYYQTKMTITDPNQKAMVYMMPIMMFLFSASFPSGLVLYWTVSNVFTIGQTLVMKRKRQINTEAKPEHETVRSSKKKRRQNKPRSGN